MGRGVAVGTCKDFERIFCVNGTVDLSCRGCIMRDMA